MIPEYITHYHLRDREPFLSLSDLDGDTEHPAFLEMLNKHKEDSRYLRRFGKDYLKVRQRAETRLRHLFVERGGRPIRRTPYYFILGQSSWFRHLNLE